MAGLVFKILGYSGLPAVMRMLFQRNKVTTLVFHEMTPDVAEINFTYLIFFSKISSKDGSHRALKH